MAAIHNVIAGSVGRLRQTITISNNQTAYVADTSKVTNYKAGSTDAVFVIESGIVVSGSVADDGAAFLIDTSWAAGDTVSIINNGTIVGRGGGGGNAGFSTGSGAPGQRGGTALRVQRAATVTNNGTLAGGGGGGGGGNGRSVVDENNQTINYQGGGGGGGRSGNVNSTAGNPGGGAGTFSAAGGGGFGASGYSGASGGNWGAAGGNAFTGVGGAGGRSVVGDSNITWVATGTRIGAVT
jgi:hypothetical protein